MLLATSQLNAGHRGHCRCHGSRHPNYMDLSKDPYKPVVVKPRPPVEADIRYRRVDNSAELAAEARYNFAAGLAAGEAGLQLAKLALLVAAEDDAIASSSVVRFPVDAFLTRIQCLAESTAAAVATAAAAAASSTKRQHQQQQQAGRHVSSTITPLCGSMQGLPPGDVVAAVQHALFKQQQVEQQLQLQLPSSFAGSIACAGLSVPAHGRTALPPQSQVDHPGVWEDARLAYLNEVQVRKRGCPAAVAILACEVYRQLLLLGAIDFAVTFDLGDFSTLPRAVPLPNVTRQQLLPAMAGTGSSSGSSHLLLNTCSSEALAELLRHLKRSYWPFPWDTNIDCPEGGGRASTGGFRAAAKAALGSDEMTAALRAVSATAAHRLQRGIWTSPGAGDLNRCLAAAERLVMMVGNEQPQESRDLAVLLLHAGHPEAAAAELSAYLDTCRPSSWQASGSRQEQDPLDMRLAQDLWAMLRSTGIKPARDVMSIEAVLKGGGRLADAASATKPHKPLTW